MTNVDTSSSAVSTALLLSYFILLNIAPLIIIQYVNKFDLICYGIADNIGGKCEKHRWAYLFIEIKCAEILLPYIKN